MSPPTSYPVSNVIPLRFDQTRSPVQHPLLHLEVGDAVAQQPTDPVRPLEDRHAVTGAIELLRRREPRRSRPDDGNAPTGAMRRWLSAYPSFIECPVDDGLLDLLDRDGFVVDGEDARRLARGRAEAAGELGKVVGGMQLLRRGLPVIGRGRSTRECGCPAGIRGGRTRRRNPCTVILDRATPAPAAGGTPRGSHRPVQPPVACAPCAARARENRCAWPISSPAPVGRAARAGTLPASP